MNIYIYILFLSLYLYIVNKVICNNKFEKILSFILFVSLFIISGIRWHVGTDYGVYLNIYRNIDNKIYSLEEIEIGYFYLNKIVKALYGGEYSIFVITSLIIIGFVYLTVKKFSLDPLLSGIIFMSLFYVTSLNIIRQYIALTIIFYSIKYYRSKYKWILFLVIASLFHKTALCIFPFYLISKLNLNKKQHILIVIVGLLLFLNYEKTVIYLTGFIEGFEHYKGTKFVLQGANPIRTLVNIFIFIFCFLAYDEINKNKIMKFSFTMIIFGVISSLFMIKGKIFARIVDYFMVFSILLIPYTVKNIKKYKIKKYSIIIISAIIGFNCYYFYYSLKTGQSDVTPYRTYINKIYIEKKITYWFYREE